MWIGDAPRPLEVLQTLVHGYYIGLSTYGIVEAVPEMGRHFSSWLHRRTKWSLSCGWADAIQSHAGDRAPLDLFFHFVDQYRMLSPVVVARARLRRSNVPTGKHHIVGADARHSRLTVVEIVRYSSTKHFFLRFHYGRRAINDSILFDGSRSTQWCEDTSAVFAKRWAAEALRVLPNQWEPP
jgi:hypothetical protein